MVKRNLLNLFRMKVHLRCDLSLGAVVSGGVAVGDVTCGSAGPFAQRALRWAVGRRLHPHRLGRYLPGRLSRRLVTQTGSVDAAKSQEVLYPPLVRFDGQRREMTAQTRAADSLE
jgi:hypothetical protein